MLWLMGKSVFDQLVKTDIRTYDNIGTIETGQVDDCIAGTGCFLYYNYFNKHYKMIAIDLSKQQAPYVDPKAMQKINFTGNLNRKNTEG